MSRELTRVQKIEQSMIRKYRKELWAPFLNAITTYQLIEPNDRIAVCISGGKDSMCMAKLFQELQRRSDFPFEVIYLVMDPGYNTANQERIIENAAILEIPIQVFETDIFRVANHSDRNPCNVIETALMSMMYASKLETLIPKVHSTNFDGMEMIRPLYCIREEAILNWCRYNDLHFIQCACRFTEQSETGHISSKRKEVKELIAALKKDNPEIEGNIFRSLHAVQLNTFPGYKQDGVLHSFLERYDHTDD